MAVLVLTRTSMSAMDRALHKHKRMVQIYRAFHFSDLSVLSTVVLRSGNETTLISTMLISTAGTVVFWSGNETMLISTVGTARLSSALYYFTGTFRSLSMH